MDKLIYKSERGKSEIFFGSGLMPLHNHIAAERTIIITDNNIRDNYKDIFPDCPILTISAGEKSKSISTVEAIIKDLLKLEVDRSFFLLGIGGGVVCDITGFVASVYMRGLKFGFISTSLLSQVDASTGGKNGVNSAGYKNIIGCFTQPDFVFCDSKMLKTLPYEEFKSGLGELVKHALIRDKELFAILFDNSEKVNADNIDLMRTLIKRSVELKLSIVEMDEKEKGERRLLNFGHTIGHAIEAVKGNKHGLAVAEGIYFSSLLSQEKGLIEIEDHRKIVILLKALNLIVGTPKILPSYIELVKRDKKRESKIMHFVLLEKIGKGIIVEIPLEELVSWMEKQQRDDC